MLSDEYHSFFNIFLASEHTSGTLIRNRTGKSLVIFDTLFEHEAKFVNVVHESHYRFYSFKGNNAYKKLFEQCKKPALLVLAYPLQLIGIKVVPKQRILSIMLICLSYLFTKRAANQAIPCECHQVSLSVTKCHVVSPSLT